MGDLRGLLSLLLVDRLRIPTSLNVTLLILVFGLVFGLFVRRWANGKGEGKGRGSGFGSKTTTKEGGPDGEEPPIVEHFVPYVGHLVGLIRFGISYFDRLSIRTGHPIFTVPILNSKVYVITSPDLVTACMRETRTLSFNPFIVEVFRRLAGLTNEDMDIVRLNMDDKSASSYIGDMHRVQYAALAPGPALDAINQTVLTSMAGFLTELPAKSSSKPGGLRLFDTVRRIASLSALRSIYGPANPFDLDPSLVDDFFVFEQDLKYILLDFCTPITVRKAHLARERLIKAFEEYYGRQGHLNASAVTQERTRVAFHHGISVGIVSAFEVGMCFGILTNAVTTAFWLVAFIFADEDLLEKVRGETAHLVNKDTEHRTINFDFKTDALLRKDCPIITSAFHETLRHISASLSAGRYVLEDTILKSRHGAGRSYLLKKGCTIQIPSQSLHFPPPALAAGSSSECSGDVDMSSTKRKASPFSKNSEAFDPYRFKDLGVSDPERGMNGSFRAFGGGSTLCPGRKFAFMEVVGLVIMVVQCFDIDQVGVGEETGKRGLGRVPGLEISKMAVAVCKPVDDVEVKIRWRDGMEGRLNVKVGKGED